MTRTSPCQAGQLRTKQGCHRRCRPELGQAAGAGGADAPDRNAEPPTDLAIGNWWFRTYQQQQLTLFGLEFGKTAPQLKDMSWVKVVGKMTFQQEGGQTVPVMEATSIVETAAPENQMIY